MPKLRKIAPPGNKKNNKKPKKELLPVYIFESTCGKGCANGESGMKNVEFTCKHGNVMKYARKVMR